TNSITRATTACFEPSLDYIVLKLPRWDFRKFELVKRKLGSTMKSVGELMAIGRSCEQVLQKAIRMSERETDARVANPYDDKTSMLSAIDPWFLIRIKNIIDMEYTLRRHSDFNEDIIKEAKRIGFSDKQIGSCLGIDELKIRSLRHRFGIRPAIKQIDTLAAEWPAK